MDLAQGLVPLHAQRRVLRLELAQRGQRRLDGDLGREHCFGRQQRLCDGLRGGSTVAQRFADAAGRQARGCDELTGLRRLHGGEPASIVQAQLVDAEGLLAHRHRVAHGQAAADELEEGQAAALRVVADAEHPRAKGRVRVVMRLHQAGEGVQKLRNARVLQRRAAKHREQLFLADEPAGGHVRLLLVGRAAQVGVEQRFVALGGSLGQLLVGHTIGR